VILVVTWVWLRAGEIKLNEEFRPVQNDTTRAGLSPQRVAGKLLGLA